MVGIESICLELWPTASVFLCGPTKVSVANCQDCECIRWLSGLHGFFCHKTLEVRCHHQPRSETDSATWWLHVNLSFCLNFRRQGSEDVALRRNATFRPGPQSCIRSMSYRHSRISSRLEIHTQKRTAPLLELEFGTLGQRRKYDDHAIFLVVGSMNSNLFLQRSTTHIISQRHCGLWMWFCHASYLRPTLSGKILADTHSSVAQMLPRVRESHQSAPISIYN